MERKNSNIINALLSIAIIALFVFLIISNTIRQKNPAQNTVSIGVILPLSGELGFVGSQMQKGIQLAVSEYEENEISVVFEDDQSFDSVVVIKALNKLINIDKVSVIFNASVNTVKSLDSVLKESGVPGMVLWDSNDTINDLKSTIYGFGYSTEKTGEKMAKYAYEELGVRNVTVVTAQDEWSEIISQAFINKFQDSGGVVAIQKRVSADENDFRTILLMAKEKRSDAVYYPLFPEPTVKLTKQARELGFETLLTGDGLVDISTDTEGVYSTQTWTDNTEFEKKYKNFFDETTDPVGLSFSGLGYDAVHFVMSAVKQVRDKGKPLTPENIKSNLNNTRTNGITGLNSFDKNNTSNKVQSITIVRNGRLELIER